jgi:hypothetical protein
LAAKPIIDMDLIVDDPTRGVTYVPALAALGYVLTIREPTWYEHRIPEKDVTGVLGAVAAKNVQIDTGPVMLSPRT